MSTPVIVNPVTEDPSNGELFRTLGRLEKAMDSGFENINNRIERLRNDFVPRELYDSHRQSLLDQLGELSTRGNTRALRITSAVAAAGGLGGIITTVVAIATRSH